MPERCMSRVKLCVAVYQKLQKDCALSDPLKEGVMHLFLKNM